jgi:hypothetical protein
LLKSAIKHIIKFCRPTETAIILIFLLLFTSGFAIYAANKPANPRFHIYDPSFKLGQDNRSIELYVAADSNQIELQQFFINNEAVQTWNCTKKSLRKRESSRCILEYPWIMGKFYTIELVTIDGQSTELVTEAPTVSPSLQVDVKTVNVTLDPDSVKVDVNYGVYGNGTDSLQVLLLTYRSFENSSMPLYIFYDSRYMPEESLRRADAIIGYFGAYNQTINKANYTALEQLADERPRCILILVNPLKDKQGHKIGDAIPAPLVDGNGDGFIKDDSKYGKSLLYDWMHDNGSVIVTVGSLQPYKRILYSDGTYRHALDSKEMFDARLLLTGASDGESIINGNFVLGDYAPARVSSTLGLHYRESSFGFDKDSMEQHALNYYAYGDYMLPEQQGTLNLTLPVFIRVGEDGGWLAMGDEGFWLTDQQLAHDLFMICLQAVWDAEWFPYGWYWDSSGAFYGSSGELSANGSLETSLPQHLVDDKIVVRIVALAYSLDLDRGVMVSQISEHEIREVASIDVDAVE